ncbi:MAG: ATP-binding protein [Gammaproteobacteria bacterium]
MFERAIYDTLLESLRQFPVAVLTGPRQSGKTTLLKQLQHDTYDYINLEFPDVLARLQSDPRGTLIHNRTKPLIIDESQKYPELFSYIQGIVDENKKKGEFILSGSQNFLLNEKITQSLSGRARILELLPLTYSEFLTHAKSSEISIWEWLFTGAYPRPYQDNIPVNVWSESYIRTYLERDVRDLLNVKDLGVFQRFLKSCAARHAQILNTNQLAIDCGVSHTTIINWIHVLEASYIVFRVQPYHANFRKRLVKSPKLYFYDAGLVCHLLNIESSEHLSIHPNRGYIFEGFAMSEIYKNFANQGKSKPLYYWRDSYGNEIDCLIEHSGKLTVIEVKSSMTLMPSLVKGLNKWKEISELSSARYVLVYAGLGDQKPLQGVDVFSWNEIGRMLFG